MGTLWHPQECFGKDQSLERLLPSRPCQRSSPSWKIQRSSACWRVMFFLPLISLKLLQFPYSFQFIEFVGQVPALSHRTDTSHIRIRADTVPKRSNLMRNRLARISCFTAVLSRFEVLNGTPIPSQQGFSETLAPPAFVETQTLLYSDL